MHDLELLNIDQQTVNSKKEFLRIVKLRLTQWSLVRILHNCFDNNETPDYPHLRYGFIRDALNLTDDGDHGSYKGTVNSFLDWMITFLPDTFFEPEYNHSRLLGRHSRKK